VEKIEPTTSVIEDTQITAAAGESEAVASTYKEAAGKVVELQRQVISLRSKLKAKESLETENEKLRKDLNETKSKYLESQKRNCQL
jgi:cell shape-determining protein MreC